MSVDQLKTVFGLSGELITAIKSRVQTLRYDPTDAQVAALMRHIASKPLRGTGNPPLRATAKECGMVCEFVLARCEAFAMRPDVRMLADKAIPDYLLWRSGESETHWEDLVVSSMEDWLATFSHPVDVTVPSKPEEVAAELDELEQILRDYHTHEDRLAAFVDATGKGIRTYQRRLRMLSFRPATTSDTADASR